MNVLESGIIKKKRNKFSQVSNHCLDNTDLTLRAKGLYSLIQSKIDIPGYTLYKTVLQDKFCKEGRDAFNSAWKELVNAGYLKIYKINSKNGFFYEYELFDEPEQSEPKQNVSKKRLKTKLKSIKSPDAEFQHVGPATVLPPVGRTTTNNTNNNNTNDNLYIDDLNKETIKSEISKLKKEIKKANKYYDCFNDPKFKNYLNDESTKNALTAFNNFHQNLKIQNLYKFESIALNWIKLYELYDSSELIINAEYKLIEVLKSFINTNEQKSILNLSDTDLTDVFKKAFEFYDPYCDSKIRDINGYLATILRSRFN